LPRADEFTQEQIAAVGILNIEVAAVYGSNTAVTTVANIGRVISQASAIGVAGELAGKRSGLVLAGKVGEEKQEGE
jgi:hypothetical protein